MKYYFLKISIFVYIYIYIQILICIKSVRFAQHNKHNLIDGCGSQFTQHLSLPQLCSSTAFTKRSKPFDNLQNAFAMATLPIIEINGTMMIPVPKFLHISTKVSVWFPTFLEKDGGSTEGSPESI